MLVCLPAQSAGDQDLAVADRREQGRSEMDVRGLAFRVVLAVAAVSAVGLLAPLKRGTSSIIQARHHIEQGLAEVTADGLAVVRWKGDLLHERSKFRPAASARESRRIE
jgi:hypothetical protein